MLVEEQDFTGHLILEGETLLQTLVITGRDIMTIVRFGETSLMSYWVHFCCHIFYGLLHLACMHICLG